MGDECENAIHFEMISIDSVIAHVEFATFHPGLNTRNTLFNTLNFVQ